MTSENSDISWDDLDKIQQSIERVHAKADHVEVPQKNPAEEHDADLDPILAQATAEDLEPLVQYILDSPMESLQGEPLYQQFAPDHTRYAGLIGREIRKFGNERLFAAGSEKVFLGSFGPPYRKIVQDVLGALHVAVDESSSLEQMELTILARMFGQVVACKSESERAMLPQSLLDELKNADQILHLSVQGMLSLGTSDSSVQPIPITPLSPAAVQAVIQSNCFTEDDFQFIGINPLMSLKMPKMAHADGGYSGWVTYHDGPFYPVTIPCVRHIAILRQKFTAND